MERIKLLCSDKKLEEERLALHGLWDKCHGVEGHEQQHLTFKSLHPRRIDAKQGLIPLAPPYISYH
jgi:hypothetical protein